MLFLGATKTSIAFATNHTLEISAEMSSSTQNKDESNGGDWATSEVNTLSWTASSENLFCLPAGGEGDTYADLFDLMIAKEPIDAVFARKLQNVTDVPSGGWDPDAVGSDTPQYVGKVIITSLSLNAPVGDFATYSAQFQGVGPLQKKTS